MPVPHLLHIFASFEVGGAQRRFLTLANTFGAHYRHTIIAMDRNFEARHGLDPGLDVTYLEPPGHKSSMLCPVRLSQLIRNLKPNLVLTYNWGAMDGVLGGTIAHVCRVIHTEDGFGSDEALTLKRRRILARRVLLNRIHQTIVPSATLHRIAREKYCLSDGKVRFIPNGVDTVRFRPGLSRSYRRTIGVRDDEVLFGYVGHLRREKNLPLLLQAFAQAGITNARLLILGSGPCEAELKRMAAELELGNRIVFHESTTDPAPFYGSMDVFVLSSSTEQMPISLLEAMACGLPALGTDVGDIRRMLACAADRALVPAGDLQSYAGALRMAAGDAAYRADAGARNRERCCSHYSLDSMTFAYQSLYEEAIRNEA